MTRHTLRPYQQADVRALVARSRGMHIGEPGVGKTLVATRAVEDAGAYPCLVTCPGYLVDQWKEHLLDEGHAPLVAATVATRQGQQRSISPAEKRELLAQAKQDKVKWVIVNHEMLRLPARKREKSVQQIWRETAIAQGWSADFDTTVQSKRKAERYDIHKGNFVSVIADELHRFRGHKSQQYRGLYSAATRQRCQMVIGLTATPIYRDVGDLYAQLRLIDPKMFTSYWAFVNTHAVVEHDDWGDHIIDARPSAQHILSQYAIARRYDDPEVQLDLPPVIPRTIRLTLTAAGHRAYHQAKREYVGTGDYLPTLRSITAGDPAKLTALDELLTDVADRGFIVFCYYRKTAIALSKRLRVPVALGGQKGNNQLAKSVGPGRPAGNGLVATVDCLQEGIDLSHLRSVIYYEEDFLPGKRKQSMMRVQRFRPDGSPDPVLVYWIVARDTVDAHIYTVCNTRGATAEEITRLEMAS